MGMHSICLCFSASCNRAKQQARMAQNYQKNLKRGMLNDSTLHLWNDG